jgi:hypothetical protein
MKTSWCCTALSTLILLVMTGCGEQQAVELTDTPPPTETRSPPTSTTIPPTSTSIPPTATAAKTIALDPTTLPVPTGYRLYESPYWLAMLYPETWVQVYDEQCGDIHFATEVYSLYSDVLPDASFQVWPTEGQTSLDELESEIEEQLASIKDAGFATQLYRTPVNGQDALIAMFKVPLEESSTVGGEPEMQSIFVAAVEGVGRIAQIVAYAHGEDQELHLKTFQTMLNSMIVREGLPGPEFTEGESEHPDGYVEFTKSNSWIHFLYPASWMPVMTDANQVYLLPADPYAERISDAGFWNTFGQDPLFGSMVAYRIDSLANVSFGDAGESPEDLLQWMLAVMGYTTPDFHDGVVVSEFAVTRRGDQEMARAYVSGTIRGEPAVGLFVAIRRGDMGVVAVAYDHTVEELTEYTFITNSLALTP